MKPVSRELKIAESLYSGYLLALVATDVHIHKHVAAQRQHEQRRSSVKPWLFAPHELLPPLGVPKTPGTKINRIVEMSICFF
jgi:hypothetical protein